MVKSIKNYILGDCKMVGKKKIALLVCGLITMSIFTGCSTSSKSDDVKEVGIVQIIQQIKDL